MRPLIFLILLFLPFAACQNNSADTGTDTSQSEQPAAKEGFNPMAGGDVIAINNKEGIQLSIADATATKGERICLDVAASSFTNVMSMQYTIEWDPNILEFSALGNFQLKNLTLNNFGAHLAAQGKLTFSWFDMDLQGITVPDNTPIYQLCYTAKGDVGSSAEVRFVEIPVPFEISNKAGQIIRFDHSPGNVSIQ